MRARVNDGVQKRRTEGGGARIRTRGQGRGRTRYYLEQDKRKEDKDGARARGPMADHHDATAPERRDQMGHHRPLLGITVTVTVTVAVTRKTSAAVPSPFRRTGRCRTWTATAHTRPWCLLYKSSTVPCKTRHGAFVPPPSAYRVRIPPSSQTNHALKPAPCTS
jgi:hypothetical protein